MSVVSQLFEEGGQYAGHALSLGDRYVFHTRRSDLADLDGRLFSTLAAVRLALDQTPTVMPSDPVGPMLPMANNGVDFA